MATTDEQLMAAYAAGDRACFRALYDRHAPWLVGFFARRGASPDERYDLLQQTFLQLHRARRDYRHGAPLRPWIYTIALNVQRMSWRRLSRRPRHVSTDDEKRPDVPDTADWEQDFATRDEVHSALAALSPAQRELVELRWFAGLATAEIAKKKDISENAAKLRVHRALKRLRQIVTTRDADGGIQRKDGSDE